MNLIGNAIKYTSRGGNITVACRGAAGRYALTVSDSGPGIPRELQARIFDRFFAWTLPVPVRMGSKAAPDWDCRSRAGLLRRTRAAWN